MITLRLVTGLGLAQLVCWGITYYLIGVLGGQMTQSFGWSLTHTYAGFSGALVVMGLTSGLVGRLIDRLGGRRVMALGAILIAAGCLGLSLARDLVFYIAAWLCMGLAMRMTLYEAAFATLVRIGGARARRAISQITLLGGLASTVFWPVGHLLSGWLGWRGALVVYAGFALLTVPLYWSIPDHRHDPAAEDGEAAAAPVPLSRGEHIVAAGLYLVLFTTVNFLSSGLSAHMIGIMAGLGMGAGLAVWVATLRGIGQTGARLCEIAFGAGLSPLALGALATGVLPLSFVVGLGSGVSIWAGAAFAFAYGAGNGLLTIARGTQPLVLFDHRTYGALVGKLTAPGFFASAFAPIVYSGVIEAFGNAAALWLSVALGGMAFACAALLWRRYRGRAAQG